MPNNEDYRAALKLGQKEYRACVGRGEYPYPQVLDEVLACAETQGEESLGLVEIPMDRIAGTKTAGRRDAFARNFMPLLDPDTEFAEKWSLLCQAHLEEGIREPVTAYEFMNRFYIQEGNKRVSVLKYFGAPTVPGMVRRILPKRRDTPESQIYFDFLEFYRLTRINYIWFSRPGRFRQLLLAVKGDDSPWTDRDRGAFRSAFDLFVRTLLPLGGGKLPGTHADAFLAYIRLYGYPSLQRATPAQLKAELLKSWQELAAYSLPQPVELELDPAQPPAKSLLDRFLAPKPSVLRTLFLYEKSPETSGWAQAHEEGRLAASEALGARVATGCRCNVTPDAAGEVIAQALESGTDVVFATSPIFLPACLKAAVEHPEVKFLVCSVYSPHPSIRTYYGRIYEGKLLAGLIAGAMTRSHRIGYMADYPIYGTAAAINAFALGARMVDPQAQVFLEWRATGEAGLWDRLADQGVDMISGQDIRSPVDPWRAFGLYRLEGRVGKAVASGPWNWGQFYLRILQSILDGEWKRSDPKDLGKAINYWWGLSAGVVDFQYSQDIPPDTLRLVQLLYEGVLTGRFQPFSGRLTAQGGRVIREEGALTPEEILRMDWLAENVVGSFPRPDQLTPDARELVAIQGVRPQDRKEGLS